jgi:DNA-directed RNA polymerase specialized sigma24 family protein
MNTTNDDGSLTNDMHAVQFENLLRRLNPDRDRAGEEYERIRRKLIKFFTWNNCCPQEDLADETLDRVARRILDGEVRNIASFTWGVAKNVARETFKRAPAIGLDQLPYSQHPRSPIAALPIIDQSERQCRLECLHNCIQKLAEPDRELFLAYEYMVKSQNREKLAASLGLRVGALQSRAHRLKHKLKECAVKCLENNSEA